MLKIGIVTGSTRPGRVNRQVADYILGKAQGRAHAEYEILDIKDFDLPLYAEPVPALFSTDYQAPQAHAWSKAVDGKDGFVFIAAEYTAA